MKKKKGRKLLRRLQTNNELNKSPGDKVWKLTWRHKKASLSVQGNARIGSTKVIHSLASSGYCNRIHQPLDLNKPRSEYICISVSSCHPKSNEPLDISLSTPLYLPVRSFLMCKGCCVQLVQSEGPMVATSRAKLKPVTLVAQKVLGPAGFYLKLVLDSSLKTKGRGQI